MWFCDGRKLGYGQMPLPNKEGIDYLDTLYRECAKLAKTNTPAYLVYMGSLITDAQKVRLQSLRQSIENLLTVDYDLFKEVVATKTKDDASSLFAEKIDGSAQEFLQNEGKSLEKTPYLDAIGTIAHLVDLARLGLIYDCNYLKEAASIENPDKAHMLTESGIIYRDFDVTVKGDQISPLKLLNGKACSTSLQPRDQLRKINALRLRRGLPAINKDQAHYIEKMTQVDVYAKNYHLYAIKNPTTQEDEREIERLYIKHKEVMGPEADFAEDLVYFRMIEGIGMGVGVENSLLAFSAAKDPDLKRSFLERRDDPAYSIVQDTLNPQPCDNQSELISQMVDNALTSVHSGFNVSRDFTWTRGVEELHTKLPDFAIVNYDKLPEDLYHGARPAATAKSIKKSVSLIETESKTKDRTP